MKDIREILSRYINSEQNKQKIEAFRPFKTLKLVTKNYSDHCKTCTQNFLTNLFNSTQTKIKKTVSVQ